MKIWQNVQYFSKNLTVWASLVWFLKFYLEQNLGGGPSSDPHRKLQGIIGSKKNHILNALPRRIGSRERIS